MPKRKLPVNGDAEFIARAAMKASDGTPALAILAARFVDTLRRTTINGTLTPDEDEYSFTNRPENIVEVRLQIDNNNLRVSLYGSPAMPLN